MVSLPLSLCGGSTPLAYLVATAEDFVGNAVVGLHWAIGSAYGLTDGVFRCYLYDADTSNVLGIGPQTKDLHFVSELQSGITAHGNRHQVTIGSFDQSFDIRGRSGCAG